VNSSHKNSQLFAAALKVEKLERKTFISWRIKLRSKQKLMSKARSVDKFLVIRFAWGVLRAKYAERMRQRNIRAVELRRIQNIFYGA
jgi:hypothetical protein